MPKFGDAMIAATKNLQKCLSLCSAEAEYAALAEAVKTVVWLRNMLLELRLDQDASRIFQDIVDCVEWRNGVAAKHSSKHKDIHIKNNYIMSIADSGTVKLVTIRTTAMNANFLTKTIAPKDLKHKINVINISD